MIRALANALILYTAVGAVAVAWLYGRWAWASRHGTRPLWYVIAGVALLAGGYAQYALLFLTSEVEQAWPDMPLLDRFDQRQSIWLFRVAILAAVWMLVCGLIGETKAGADYVRWDRAWRRWVLGAAACFPLVWWLFLRLNP